MWLETFPDKITFGTDCFPYNEVLGAEEATGWERNHREWPWPRRWPR